MPLSMWATALLEGNYWVDGLELFSGCQLDHELIIGEKLRDGYRR